MGMFFQIVNGYLIWCHLAHLAMASCKACHLANWTVCLQAAQKALAEMNGIPEPSSPLKAAHMCSSMLHPPDGDDINSSDDFAPCEQPDSPLGSTATDTGGASEKRQSRANRVAGEPHQRPLLGGAFGKSARPQRLAGRGEAPFWSDLHAADGVRVREELPTPATGPSRARPQQGIMHITAEKPKPRKRVAGNMDFGVQVYAPEPPPAPCSTQVCCSSPDLHDELSTKMRS